MLPSSLARSRCCLVASHRKHEASGVEPTPTTSESATTSEAQALPTTSRSWRNGNPYLEFTRSLQGPTCNANEREPTSFRDKLGMTWARVSHDDELGIDLVGCYGTPPVAGGKPACDPYVGDTSFGRSSRGTSCLGEGNSHDPGPLACTNSETSTVGAVIRAAL